MVWQLVRVTSSDSRTCLSPSGPRGPGRAGGVQEVLPSAPRLSPPAVEHPVRSGLMIRRKRIARLCSCNFFLKQLLFSASRGK